MASSGALSMASSGALPAEAMRTHAYIHQSKVNADAPGPQSSSERQKRKISMEDVLENAAIFKSFSTIRKENNKYQQGEQEKRKVLEWRGKILGE